MDLPDIFIRMPTAVTYLEYIFSELPDVQFGQHPEFLEEFLPWSPEIKAACKQNSIDRVKISVYTGFGLFLYTLLLLP